jgi:hypothetical protein
MSVFGFYISYTYVLLKLKPKKLIFNSGWIYRSLLLLICDRLFSKP